MALDNMASFETWAFLPTFDNAWISETFSRDTEVITKALTNTSDDKNVSFSETPISLPVHSVSSSGGSEPETPPVSKRPPRNPCTKKISKRKTRKTKRSPTTFIVADPDNFRQMVQQVTGVQLGSASGLTLKPEPQRVGFGPGHLLPTLDTSAFLLDNVGPRNVRNGPQGFGPIVGSSGGPKFDFDGLNCFPTLESWKVM
ncbi:hypothetical protein RND81_05G178600 [Saponaria officinalis]|uniref:VQ domain-containing protein n=1 Tax=Saponaria officinalis TaxID=3572 RepID=A0AAW1L0H5_SAPOF